MIIDYYFPFCLEIVKKTCVFVIKKPLKSVLLLHFVQRTWYNFSMKTRLLSGVLCVYGKTIVTQGLTGLQLLFNYSPNQDTRRNSHTLYYFNLKKIMDQKGLRQVDILKRAEPFCDKYNIKLGKNDLSQYINGKVEPGQEKLSILSLALGVSETWLMGYEVSPEGIMLPEPETTEDYVTFPVIGEVSAGYEHVIQEDWSGDTISIPIQYLRGRPKSDFLVLTVCGNSMYPLYLEGDNVLILKQQTLDRSGDIGLIRYNGECATLKKVEYVIGEEWMKLIPLNPEYPPRTIEGTDLEECEIIGVPWLLIREIKK